MIDPTLPLGPTGHFLRARVDWLPVERGRTVRGRWQYRGKPRRPLMTEAERKQAAGKAVAKRGIVLSSAHNRRTATSSRITETSRKTAQAKVRAAMRRP